MGLSANNSIPFVLSPRVCLYVWEFFHTAVGLIEPVSVVLLLLVAYVLNQNSAAPPRGPVKCFWLFVLNLVLRVCLISTF